MSAVIAAGGKHAPALTAEQLFELQLHEQAIRDALGVGMGSPVSDVLIIPTDGVKDPELNSQTDSWIATQAAAAKHVVGSGLTTDHFRDHFATLNNVAQVAWTVRYRDDYASDPDCTGYAVLKEAGLISG